MQGYTAPMQLPFGQHRPRSGSKARPAQAHTPLSLPQSRAVPQASRNTPPNHHQIHFSLRVCPEKHRKPVGISMEKNKIVAKFSSSVGEVGGQAGPRAELSHLRAKPHGQRAAQAGFCWVTLFLAQEPVFLVAHFQQDKPLTNSCTTHKLLQRGY